MIARAMLLTAALALAGCQHRWETPEVAAIRDKALRAYIACTISRAAEMAMTPEPADVVARAAASGCPTESAAYLESEMEHGPSKALALEASERVRRSAERNLISFIIEKRARAATPSRGFAPPRTLSF